MFSSLASYIYFDYIYAFQRITVHLKCIKQKLLKAHFPLFVLERNICRHPGQRLLKTNPPITKRDLANQPIRRLCFCRP